MTAPEQEQTTLVGIRREAWDYALKKPGKVPPADSPSRPHLAKLWDRANRATLQRRHLRTFTHAGWRFGVVFVDEKLCVFDWATRVLLVRHPGSMDAFAELLRSCDAGPL